MTAGLVDRQGGSRSILPTAGQAEARAGRPRRPWLFTLRRAAGARRHFAHHKEAR
jgi:hypothetical protein